MQPDAESLNKPANPPFTLPRSHIFSLEYVPTKHNFSEVFDIPEFTGEDVHFKRDFQGNFNTSLSAGARIRLRKPRTKGKANRTMMEKYGQTASSEPWEFPDASLPFNNKSIQSSKQNYFSFKNVCMWTN